ncbi:MAG: hypothetical protein FJZ56_06065 [Chlamydiae bacterium]|nr:hypothetical protein [Chlamydiota bacterium]
MSIINTYAWTDWETARDDYSSIAVIDAVFSKNPIGLDRLVIVENTSNKSEATYKVMTLDQANFCFAANLGVNRKILSLDDIKLKDSEITKLQSCSTPTLSTESDGKASPTLLSRVSTIFNNAKACMV